MHSVDFASGAFNGAGPRVLQHRPGAGLFLDAIASCVDDSSYESSYTDTVDCMLILSYVMLCVQRNDVNA